MKTVAAVVRGSKALFTTKSVAAISPSGADYIVDTASVPCLPTEAATALESLGLMSTGNNLEINHSQLLAQGNVVQGFIQGHRVPQLFILQLITLYAKGLVPFDKMFTFYRLEEINQAVEDQLTGKVIKPVLH